MDPLTHCLIGAVSAKAVKSSPRRFWVMALLGLAPDLDMIFNGFGGWAHVLQHRGISHSLVGIVLQAVFFSFVLSRWDKGPFRERALHYSLPLIFHVFCDYVTSYGVPLLSPFTLVNFSWDLTGSINLFPIALTLVGLWWLHTGRLSGWSATAPLWGIWVLYFVLASTGRSYASRLTSVPTANMTVIPSLISPFSWRALEFDHHNRDYRHYRVDILSGQVKFLGTSARPNGDFPVQRSMESALVKEFMENNRWPVVRVQTTREGWRVEWGTIIYSVRGMVRGKVVVHVDPDGKIMSEQPVVSFWNPELN